LCIRYVFHNKVQEDFLILVIVENTSGFNLSKVILHQLDDFGLNIKYLRGQGYDGGANMSGKYQGVQAQILKIQHLALYTHCASHCLNLTCSIVLIRNVVGNIQEVITFFRSSPKRILLLKTTLMKVLSNSKSCRLKSVCETRWIERHDAIIQFLELYDTIINCLDELGNSNEETTSTTCKANNLLNCMLKFEFLITLQVLTELFSITLPLSKQLQNQNVEYFQSLKMVKTVVEEFENKRKNDIQSFNSIYTKSLTLADMHKIKVKKSRTCSRQINRENILTNDPKEYFHYLISDIKNRFVGDGHETIMYLQYLIPFFLREDTDIEKMIESAKFFIDDLIGSIEEIRGEITLWKKFWKSQLDKPKTAIETLIHASEFYPNIKELLKIICVIPVTTCTAERTFSSLRRTKTYLRSTIGEDRLNGLMLLNIHRDIKITPDEVIEEFSKKHTRKLQLQYIMVTPVKIFCIRACTHV
ncbi:52 kDa repressor of the inhibitor of the protein kinase-like, partial [Aphis craccivora]